MAEDKMMDGVRTNSMQEKQTRGLFFIAMSISLLGVLFRLSTWPGCEYANKIGLIGMLVLLPRLTTVFVSMPVKYRQVILICIPFIIITVVSVDDHSYVLYPFVFCIAAWKIPFKSIIKVFFAINLIFLIVSMIASVGGIIENTHGWRFEMDLVDAVSANETRDRNAFGYNWYTAFAAHVTYLNLMWWYLRDGILKKIDYAFIVFSIWFVYNYCDARTETFCMMLIILLSFYYKFRVKKVKRLSWIEEKTMSYSIVICASVMIFLTYQYYMSGDEIYKIINILTSNRLYWGSDAMFTYGIKPFGQVFIQSGGDSGIDYNFIDCSYLVWLIIYGVFFFFLAMFVLTRIIKDSVKKHDYLLAIILSLLAVQSSIVSVFLVFSFNPFYMVLFADRQLKQSNFC